DGIPAEIAATDANPPRRADRNPLRSRGTGRERQDLGGLCPADWFLVLQQLGDPHQVVGQHRRSDQNLEPLAPFGQTAPHAPAANQNRDPALDADPEPLALLELRAALEGLSLRGLGSAPLGNAYMADPRLLALLLILGAVETTIACVQLRRSVEGLLMTIQRRSHLDGIGRVSLQYLIVSDQALCALCQENLVAKFHWLSRLAPLD